MDFMMIYDIGWRWKMIMKNVITLRDWREF